MFASNTCLLKPYCFLLLSYIKCASTNLTLDMNQQLKKQAVTTALQGAKLMMEGECWQLGSTASKPTQPPPT